MCLHECCLCVRSRGVATIDRTARSGAKLPSLGRRLASSQQIQNDRCERRATLVAMDVIADALAFTLYFDARPSAWRLQGAADLVSHARSGWE